MKLPYQQFWMILWCWTIQIPVKQTVTMTKLTEPTVRHWFEEFRKQLPAEYDTLEHLVQLDEAYFGGKKGRTLFLGKQVGSRKLHTQIGLGDLLIGATTLYIGGKLLTANKKHFRLIPNLKFAQ